MWNVAVRPSGNHMPPALESSRGINGKRKLPPGCPPVYNPAAGSVSANSVPQYMNFAFEKRPCRPVMPMQKQEPNYNVKSFAGLSFISLLRAKRSVARYCHDKLSVRLSVCLSVCNVGGL